MLKRPSVSPKSQKTTFYSVFTFVSDVSTFLLVKSGKTALHGRFRSRPSPHPFVPDLDLRGGHLLFISALAACPGAASFLSQLAPAALPPPGRLLRSFLSGTRRGTLAVAARDAEQSRRRAEPPTGAAPARTDRKPYRRCGSGGRVASGARERRSPRRKLPQAPQARTGAGSAAPVQVRAFPALPDVSNMR